MNFSQFFSILRARYKLILSMLVLMVSATVLVTSLLPPVYKATTTLLMNYKGQDPVTGMTLSAALMPGYMATQIDIITSENVALRVVDNLKLAQSPGVIAQFQEATQGRGAIREWLAALILNGLEVEPSRDSGVLNITFKGKDPEFVALMANAFAEAYQQATVQLRVDPAEKTSGYFNTQIKQLRDRFEASQAKLTAYQKEHNINDVDGRLDIETSRLNELSSQLVAAQTQSMEASSRQRQAQGDPSISPDVMNSALVQGLNSNLLAAEAKLADVSQRLGVNHPQYLAAKSEIDKLRSNLREQTKLATSSVSTTARIMQQREGEIRASLATQRAKVAGLNGARDQLRILANDVTAAQTAYESALQRLNQTRMEAQLNQSDISVLNPAKVPLGPTGPRFILLLILSIFLGLMLGLGLAVLVELIDRRVRTARDLFETLDIPVMGVMTLRNPRQRRRLLGAPSRLLSNNMNPG